MRAKVDWCCFHGLTRGRIAGASAVETAFLECKLFHRSKLPRFDSAVFQPHFAGALHIQKRVHPRPHALALRFPHGRKIAATVAGHSQQRLR